MPATIVAAGPVAAYALLDRAWGVVGVATGDGVALPNAICAPVPASSAPWLDLAPGDRLHVGDGVVVMAGCELAVQAWWDPRPRPGSADPVALRAAIKGFRALLPGWPSHECGPDAVVSRLCEGVERLGHAVAQLATAEAYAACDDLIGLGHGSTPTGDDVVGGLLAGADAAIVALTTAGAPTPGGWPAFRASLGNHVLQRARVATSVLSASLLEHAHRGEVARPLHGSLAALTSAGCPVDGLPDLLALGATSGHDVAEGLWRGAHAALAATTRHAEATQ